MLAKLLRSYLREEARPDALPAEQRVYAVGDVHGRLDLLDDLLARIGMDDERRAPAHTSIIFLGDLIDRGPDSAGVVERLRSLSNTDRSFRFLTGNHEEIFRASLSGDDKAIRLFCRVGGRETALSYGLSLSDYERSDWDELAQLLDEVVPADHREFIVTFEDSIIIGDYMFTHAGVRPERPLDQQRPIDLRWIREPFLNHRGHLGKMIVHGHTVAADVEFRPHRIGIDTGAYLSGKLTALGLQGTERWLLQT